MKLAVRRIFRAQASPLGRTFSPYSPGARPDSICGDVPMSNEGYFKPVHYKTKQCNSQGENSPIIRSGPTPTSSLHSVNSTGPIVSNSMICPPPNESEKPESPLTNTTEQSMLKPENVSQSVTIYTTAKHHCMHTQSNSSPDFFHKITRCIESSDDDNKRLLCARIQAIVIYCSDTSCKNDTLIEQL